MPNNYGIIICDESRKANAAIIGRKLLNGVTQTWQRLVLHPHRAMDRHSVKSNIPADGNFTGHFLILVHGNYNPQNNRGLLILEEPPHRYTYVTKRIIKLVKGIVTQNAKMVYIFACGQGRPEILQWYRGAEGFNMRRVCCPCVTAAIGGALDKNDIKRFFGLP